jgi:hypothetical protein
VAVFIAYPLVLVNVVNLTGFELDFLYVFVSTDSVDLGPLDSHSGKETLFLKHRSLVEDVLLHKLEAVVAHASDQEPRANVFVLLLSDRVTSSSSSIQINACEMTRELSLILSDQTPLREFFLFITFNKETTDFVSTEFEPVHIVSDI